MLLLLLLACRGGGDPITATDADGDGVLASSDCDDHDPSIGPGAEELCDGVDQDCDGLIDERAADGRAFFFDGDGDGDGDPLSAASGCGAPAGWVETGTDCDDADATVHPGAEEPDCTDPKDYDCDGLVAYADADADGAAACEDCDDTDPGARPGATETCNARDDDCDGSVDEGAIDGDTFFLDADGDGFGTRFVSKKGCSAPPGYVANSDDCDDTDAQRSPKAKETCDGDDDDCDGETDEDAVDGTSFWIDEDGDGYGNTLFKVLACEQPAGYATNPHDCFDDDPDYRPGAVWYFDSDGDGYGDKARSRTACAPPSGYVASPTDCDDRKAAIHPGAEELCDGLDNDCDGAADDTSVLGTGAKCAAESCADLRAARPELPTGAYWIDPLDTGTGFSAWCDMKAAGGGWTLVGKVTDPYGWVDTNDYGNLWHADNQVTSVDAKRETGKASGVHLKNATSRRLLLDGARELRFSFYDDAWSSTEPSDDAYARFSGTPGLFDDGQIVDLRRAKGDYTWTIIHQEKSGKKFGANIICWGNQNGKTFRSYEHGLFMGHSADWACHMTNDKDAIQVKSHYARNDGTAWYLRDVCGSGTWAHALLEPCVPLQVSYDAIYFWVR